MRKMLSAEFSWISVLAIAILAFASFADYPLECAVIALMILGIDFDVSFKDKEA